MEQIEKNDLMKDYLKLRQRKVIKSDKYILNYSNKLKNGDIIFICKYYKDQNIKCKAL